jgi:hypothetical protein
LVASIDFIGKELKDGDDDLARWAKDRPGHFISNSDTETQEHFSRIVQYVMGGDYNPGNRDNFLAKADPWIIAKAKVLGAVVVTHESLTVPGAKKVKVPNICAEFDVRCIDTFQFLRELEARFVLP